MNQAKTIVLACSVDFSGDPVDESTTRYQRYQVDNIDFADKGIDI